MPFYCWPRKNPHTSINCQSSVFVLMYPILDKRISGLSPPRSGYPPWILKRGGLESSGRRLISPIGKKKENSIFFLRKKNIKKKSFFFVKSHFFDFLVFLDCFDHFQFFWFWGFNGFFGFFWILLIFLRLFFGYFDFCYF